MTASSPPHAPADIAGLSAVSMLQGIQQGQLTTESICKALLSRAASRKDVGAWVYLNNAHILDEARRLDHVPQSERGPLHGLPVAVKDLFYTKDMPTQFGSSKYRNHACPIDASAVAILREAGCLILGKTVTTEFAMTMSGKHTKNPHNLLHTPGGSSSGSAAAVADFQTPISIGTQTYGSIIRPASFCGIYGFKPTWEVIPLAGCKGFCKTLDTIGFFARELEDIVQVSRLFDLPQGIPARNRPNLSSARIGWCKTPIWPKATPEAVAALQQAVDALSREGAVCTELVLPTTFDTAQLWHRQISTKELSRSILSERLLPGKPLDIMLNSFVEEGTEVTWQQYKEALDGYAALRPEFDAMAGQYDAVLTLSAPGEAPNGLEYTGDSSFCVIWTTLHVPVVNIPGFGGPKALPIGLSLIAPRWCDAHLLSIAEEVGRVFQKHGNWKSQLE